MMKTIGKVAQEASDEFEDTCDESSFLRMTELSWEAAANAVLEEAAKIAESEKCSADEQIHIASAIRARKTQI
jgi:hypothetical protein